MRISNICIYYMHAMCMMMENRGRKKKGKVIFVLHTRSSNSFQYYISINTKSMAYPYTLNIKKTEIRIFIVQ